MAQNCLLLLAGGLPKGSLPTSMEGEPSTDVVFGGFSDKVPPFALKKKTALPAKKWQMRLVSTVGEMFSFLLLFIHFVLSVRVRILRIMTGDGK